MHQLFPLAKSEAKNQRGCETSQLAPLRLSLRHGTDMAPPARAISALAAHAAYESLAQRPSDFCVSAQVQGAPAHCLGFPPLVAVERFALRGECRWAGRRVGTRDSLACHCRASSPPLCAHGLAPLDMHGHAGPWPWPRGSGTTLAPPSTTRSHCPPRFSPTASQSQMLALSLASIDWCVFSTHLCHMISPPSPRIFE